MELLSLISAKEKRIFLISLLLALTIIIIQTVLILIFNSGLFVYTVDDSYIHLALAENIFKGHYGINLNEYSSPSSSIIWPFILAPFSGLSFGYYIPFIINILSAVGTLYIFWLIIKNIFFVDKMRLNSAALLFLILLIIATNLVGSIFGGMEHPLQVFFTVIIIWGLINEILNKQISKWLIAAIIIAPLIRYENLALSFIVLFFLYIRGYRRKSIISLATIILLMGGFSIFLLSMGLKPLPLSVLTKLSPASSDGNILSIFENLKNNLLSPRCALLFIGMLFLFRFSLSLKSNKKESLLAGCLSFAILMHLLFSKDGRYVVYIWTATLLIFLYLYRDRLIKIIIDNSVIKTTTSATIIILIVSYSYIYGTIMIPVASNNIYEQQYQMHRFVTEYYKQPVAVNDLGYVAYQNDNYVLDLVGLASLDVQNLKRETNSHDWMNKATSLHNVKFAMIYDKWFDALSANWNKIAEMHLGKIKMAPAESIVAFYILDNEIKKEVNSQLKKFKETLPYGVKLIIWE